MKLCDLLLKGLKPLLLAFVCSILFYGKSHAQSNPCPVNIDFEFGNFINWKAYTGTTSNNSTSNFVTVFPTTPTPGLVDIIPKGSGIDPYGNFPTSAPDGSQYSVKLGNDGTGAQADRLTYDFDVPNNQNDFVLTYQYAVVLEDPGHTPQEQPRFTAKVFDVTDNTYVTCGSFEYIATAALPGFKHTASGTIIYKEWTPVSINLNGFGGHKLRLEFTAADCTISGHFGYAYIDVNNSCSELIKGISFCPAEPNVKLTGPAGFSKYTWYSADRSKVLGNTQNLSLPTAGADGTKVVLDLVPFTGFGCNYSIAATLVALPGFTFKVTNPAAVCYPATVDLTKAQLTQGSDANLTYTYWKDDLGTIAQPSPNAITVSGTYYIKATSPSGCTDTQPVVVIVNALPVVTITNPQTVCLNTPTNLTAAAITAGSTTVLTYTYWTDAAATAPLTNPNAVTVAGTYYIMGTTNSGCSVIKPVVVTNYQLPVLIIINPAAVCFPSKVNITTANTTTGSDANLNLSYWTDAAATLPLTNPAEVVASGTFYIKAINSNGCEKVQPVTVTVYALPQLNIHPPLEVCYPDKVDITTTAVTAGSSNIAQLTYWRDANATTPLTSPAAVADSGMYYIKAISVNGCELIKPVIVNIHKLPVVIVKNPGKVYAPGTIDLTRWEITTGSSPKLKFTYFNDEGGSNQISEPRFINTSGTYYIKATNIYGCYTIKPIEVTVATVPQIMVPKAFTPSQLTNNKLYPFLIGIKTFKFFKVFNRWGALVFQTTNPDPDSGWNGLYQGQMHFMDTFIWQAEGYDYVGNLVHKSGNTLLLK